MIQNKTNQSIKQLMQVNQRTNAREHIDRENTLNESSILAQDERWRRA